MINCKRCKTNEAEKCSLNCEKCNERNKNHTSKLISESKSKVVNKLDNYGAYGGLGSELESGHMNYNTYFTE